MLRAIRLLSLIALGCAAVTIWFTIRSAQISLSQSSGAEFGPVEFFFAFSLALSITALLLGMVILGFIATLRRRQWRWLAAIAAFALGTGAALYELARENISPQYTQQGSRSGLILPQWAHSPHIRGIGVRRNPS